MIDQPTEERATLYVLDLLSEEERCAFEASLQGNSELKKLVRQLSAALHTPFKEKNGPSRPDLLDGILSRCEAPPKTLAEQAGLRREVLPSALPWAHIWAIAAILFLVLNLSLLFILQGSASDDSAEAGKAPIASEQPSSDSSVTGIELTDSLESILQARIARLEKSLSTREQELQAIRQERQELEAQNEEVRSYNNEWQQEYARLAARVMPFFEPNEGLSRFTVIEMVDADAYDSGFPRLGFNELAARYLSGEGNIAGIGSNEFVGPFVEGTGVASATADTTMGGLIPIAKGDAPPSAFQEMRIPDTALTSSDTPQAVDPSIVGERPAGFTVWRDDEQKGFLDLYNLPEPLEGQEAFLWARSSELEPYVPVGALPALDHGTGSLFYSVDETNFTPAEILITSEAPGAAGDQPSGSILLRGP